MDFFGDIRGGDSFSDIYGVKRILIGSIPMVVMTLLKKGTILLPQTYGPYKSLLSRKIASITLKKSKKVLCRDLQSIDVVKNLVKAQHHGKIHFCPDVAFTMRSVVPAEISLQPGKKDGGKGLLVGVNVSGLLYSGGYTRDNMFGLKFDYPAFVDRLVEGFLLDPGIRVLLVPHTFGGEGEVMDDYRASRLVYEKFIGEFPGKMYLFNERYDQYELKGIIGLCDFFIGSRMHACIAALSQGIPAVGVAYSQKFLGVFTSVGMDSFVVDARTVGNGEAIEGIRTKVSNLMDVDDREKVDCSEARSSVRKIFQEIMNDVS